MLDTLWQKLSGGPRGEPEVVDIARLPELVPSVLRSLSRELKLLATPAADPRAFYDAPSLRGLSPALRVSLANGHALDAHRVCPPYFARRRDGRDRLFCACAPEDGPPVRVEVEFTPDGLVGPPGAAFAPEAALDLDRLLRTHDFWLQPTLAGPVGAGDGLDGELWHLSVVLGGRHHLLRRWSPKGRDHDLLAGVFLVLGVDAAAQRRERARLRTCAWRGCAGRPVRGDPSHLCAEHRARVDAQGENLQRRRRR